LQSWGISFLTDVATEYADLVSVDRQTMILTGLATSATKGRTVPRSYTVQISGQTPRELALGARAVVLGAHSSCDAVLEDAQISRRHVELQAEPQGVRVKDLGSTNGTWWQGSRITEVLVSSGAVIQVGAISLRISANDAPSIPPSERDHFGAMAGKSLGMRELFAVLELAAPTDATVLIEGESGTGKEVTARAIHEASARSAAPFVVVDCSAISESLIESHLFGHVRGAFTGADRERKGAFVEATGGTLFLDELGELPLPAQAKLLRALEARTVQPVGADRTVAVDARVVAATHRDLAKMVAAKEFRFDLFYRLAVVHVALPALRQRLEDLPHLIGAFYAARGLVSGPIEGGNLERMQQHSWPGNVRELRNVLERAWALSGVATGFRELRLWLDASMNSQFSEVVDSSLGFKEAKERWNDHFERRYVSMVFAGNGNNVTRAAEHAGLSRRHFRELLYKHSLIERPSDSGEESEG
jgi:DNA-binding NtrC family response regulator